MTKSEAIEQMIGDAVHTAALLVAIYFREPLAIGWFASCLFNRFTRGRFLL